MKGKKKETGEKNHSWYNKESFMERNLKLFNPNDLKSNLDDWEKYKDSGTLRSADKNNWKKVATIKIKLADMSIINNNNSYY